MRKLTPNESHYVLQDLVASGAVRAKSVEKALRGREDEIRSLRERLASLESLSAASSRSRGGAGRGKGGRGRRGRPPAAAGARPRRRRRMSPKTRALRKLQGKYMGLVRGLKPAEKSRVRAVREKQGMGAAIALASSLGKKG
jgi:hypothetical protein